MPRYPKDLTGLVFGRLRVLGRNETVATRWDCLCDPDYGGCGATKLAVPRSSLARHDTRSCGCLRRVRAAAARRTRKVPRKPAADLTGKSFGRWTVVGVSPRQPNEQATYWCCRCGCGAIRRYRESTLRAPGRKQCMQCYHRTPRTKACRNCGRLFTGHLRQLYCLPSCRLKHRRA